MLVRVLDTPLPFTETAVGEKKPRGLNVVLLFELSRVVNIKLGFKDSFF